jgi:hypothetical protein
MLAAFWPLSEFHLKCVDTHHCSTIPDFPVSNNSPVVEDIHYLKMELEYNYLPSPFQVGKMASRRKC